MNTYYKRVKVILAGSLISVIIEEWTVVDNYRFGTYGVHLPLPSLWLTTRYYFNLDRNKAKSYNKNIPRYIMIVLLLTIGQDINEP